MSWVLIFMLGSQSWVLDFDLSEQDCHFAKTELVTMADRTGGKIFCERTTY